MTYVRKNLFVYDEKHLIDFEVKPEITATHLMNVHENYESINQNPADVHYYVFFCFMESVGKNLLPVFAVFLLVFLFIETSYKYNYISVGV